MSDMLDPDYTDNDFSQSLPPQIDPEEVGIRLTQYVDLRLDTMSARMDGIQGELRAALESKPGSVQLWLNTVATIIGVGGIMLAALAIGGDRFEGGMSVSPILSAIQAEQRERDTAQDQKLDAILKQLEVINSKSENSPPEGQD